MASVWSAATALRTRSTRAECSSAVASPLDAASTAATSSSSTSRQCKLFRVVDAAEASLEEREVAAGWGWSKCCCIVSLWPSVEMGKVGNQGRREEHNSTSSTNKVERTSRLDQKETPRTCPSFLQRLGLRISIFSVFPRSLFSVNLPAKLFSFASRDARFELTELAPAARNALSLSVAKVPAPRPPHLCSSFSPLVKDRTERLQKRE